MAVGALGRHLWRGDRARHRRSASWRSAARYLGEERPAGWAEKLGGSLTATGSLRLTDAGPVEQLLGYGDGAWWVQDMAAALPARLLGDVAGKRVADLCAAPGGKTMQLAAAGAG